MNEYIIIYTDGRCLEYSDYDSAIQAIELEYPGCEVGHDGALTEGGDRTLAWSCADDADNDDGSRAVASIRLFDE